MSEEKLSIWFAFTIDSDKRETVFGGAASTEQEAVQKAKRRIPGLPALAIGMRNDMSAEQLHAQCIQRLAEIDIIGSEVISVSTSIAHVMTQVMIEGVIKPQSEECAWFLNTLHTANSIKFLSNSMKDRLTKHIISCEKCRRIVSAVMADMKEDFGLSPERLAAVEKAADESYERVTKGEKA